MYIKVYGDGTYEFFTPEIHGEEFCKNECIKITDEFYEFLKSGENQGRYLIDVSSIDDVVGRDNLIERPIQADEDRLPTQEERLEALEQAMLEMILGGVV